MTRRFRLDVPSAEDGKLVPITDPSEASTFDSFEMAKLACLLISMHIGPQKIVVSAVEEP